MDEPITLTCPHCRRRLSVPAQHLGQRAECSLCGRMFTVQTGDAPNPPAASSGQPAALSPGSQPAVQPITPLMAQHLLASRPWVLFLSIMGFILCGLMALEGLGMMVGGGLAGRLLPPGFPHPPPGLPLPMAAVGLIYLVLAGLCVVPAWLLFNYAAAIKRYRYSASSRNMAAALKSQKSFWKFVGIMTIVVMAMYLVIFLVGMVVGMIMTMD